ncbi:hypothetical protein HTV80_29000 [Streptomyces sp. Vc74B-19]|uniref:hypothetical protein n=1 Tax=unclassified Streptomyces TaxID=2593676 RepID=UPI001BFCCD57|nr:MULTISPECIES: hypothetical protein [unclassified Streptomyces]MBT3167102.1 hypothetical protein [Streptomyces sp. Vc74B-19]MDU0302884.1 hypothetical protein [Streptomyces sp. PAL114]
MSGTGRGYSERLPAAAGSPGPRPAGRAAGDGAGQLGGSFDATGTPGAGTTLVWRVPVGEQ